MVVSLCGVVHLSVRQTLLSTAITTCRINFDFIKVIDLICLIRDTGIGPCSSLYIYLMAQLFNFRVVVPFYVLSNVISGFLLVSENTIITCFVFNTHQSGLKLIYTR